MEYLTFARYVELGGLLPEATFKSMYRKAKAKIDYYTFGRLKEFTTIPQEVEDCIMEMLEQIEVIQSALQPENGNVASESANGYSVTYGSNNASAITSANESENIISNTVEMYLIDVHTADGTPVLYRGV